jgi:hypothetical protein
VAILLGGDDLRRSLGLALGPILASGRAASALDLRHPSWWPSTASTAASCQPFQRHDRFFDLFAFLAQFGQHLVNVHSSVSRKIWLPWARFVRKTEQDRAILLYLQ